VRVLRTLGGSGPALELGIGTGRVALPLASSGVEVQGLDASERMVERLRTKPGGAEIPVTVGDFRSFELDTRFRLVYVVFNTFFGLLSQEDQIGCFERVARHLTPDGVFVIEAFVPDPSRYERGQRTSTVEVGIDHVELETSVHHPADQRVDAIHTVLRPDGARLYPVRLRYAWPSELDLMGRLAGLRLRERWGGWNQEPYSGEDKHVSVYERDPEASA
jgi:SAM-dependent methyltransferase